MLARELNPVWDDAGKTPYSARFFEGLTPYTTPAQARLTIPGLLVDFAWLSICRVLGETLKAPSRLPGLNDVFLSDAALDELNAFARGGNTSNYNPLDLPRAVDHSIFRKK
jgi:hypothetical protein